MSKKKKSISKKGKRLLTSIIAFLIVAVLVIAAYAIYTFAIEPMLQRGTSSSSMSGSSSSSSSLNSSTSSSSSSSSSNLPDTSSSSGSSNIEETYSPISFHFLDLNIQYTGDCTYIKAGDNDILIDAGARKASGEVICDYLDQYVEDGKLEYVIATHAHQDHIAGFVGNSDSSKPKGRTGVFYNYEVETLIDFPLSDATTAIYSDYLEAVSMLVEEGTTHYTALDCVKEQNGAQRIYSLGEGVSMEVLYNFFYDHTRNDFRAEYPGVSGSFSEENDYSVSLLFRQGEKAMLFTGDSEAWSEHSLVAENDLPENVVLYKGGHHGSYTATGEELLAATSPDAIVFECTAGNSEFASDPNHSFPAQETIDRIAPYTDRVYVTQVGSWEDRTYHAPLNGTVIASYDSMGNENFAFSNSSEKLKDTSWFQENRNTPEAWLS